MRVFSTACDSASITSIVSKWRPLSFILNQGNRNPEWVADDSHDVFGQKFPSEKGSVRRRVVVMQQLVLLLPEFRAKSLQTFKQSP
jgi:hypothetical protein